MSVHATYHNDYVSTLQICRSRRLYRQENLFPNIYDIETCRLQNVKRSVCLATNDNAIIGYERDDPARTILPGLIRRRVLHEALLVPLFLSSTARANGKLITHPRDRDNFKRPFAPILCLETSIIIHLTQMPRPTSRKGSIFI